jgi:hypothetical protein
MGRGMGMRQAERGGWHMEAFERSQIGSAWPDGTYELIGPLATEPGTSVNAAGRRTLLLGH